MEIKVNTDSVNVRNSKAFEDLREAALGNTSPFKISEIIELATITSKKKFIKRFKQLAKENGIS